jgi:NNP family nitrate/nitrite transporter-like MFS transporter
MKIAQLFSKSVVNPQNGKAKTLAFFNLTDMHTRNFHLSWFCFFVAFFSWFGFPPLLAVIIKDLGLSTTDYLNSNVLGLTSTLFVRIFSGTLCDKYGPRLVMVGLLLAGAIPTCFVYLIQDAPSLLLIRFFIGVLGGTFVPCQVWTTTFYDKNIVGTVNAIAGGWGNAGGGAIFFAMPAVMEALIVNQKLSISMAWRTSFIVLPLVMIVTAALLAFFFGDDCPQGKWKDRIAPTLVIPDNEEKEASTVVPSTSYSFKEAFEIAISPTTMLAFLPYVCTFGAELAVEGVISNLYIYQSKLFGDPAWSVTTAGAWASVFGLLNIFTRPLGGVIADLLYKRTNSVDIKKWWMMFLGIGEGIMFLIIGFLPNMPVFTLIGIMCILAFFMEFGNGANYALVPHLNPHRNGLVSGMVGAGGNVGGIIFSLVFRFNGSGANYYKSMWICGILVLVFHLMVIWIPVPKESIKEKSKMESSPSIVTLSP